MSCLGVADDVLTLAPSMSHFNNCDKIFRLLDLIKKMDFRLVLVRHGETGHNAGSVIQGQLDIPLSTTGISQSKLLFNTLNKMEWKEVWASDLKRAWQTANFALNSEDSLDEEALLSSPLPLINTDIRMRERHYGEAQGQSLTHLQKLAGNCLVSEFVPPGAESPEELRERVISFFQDLCKRITSSAGNNINILMISHGGWIREFLSYLTFISRNVENFGNKMVGRICPNTAVSQFQIFLGNDGSVSHIQCLSLHDRSHLTNSSAILCEEMAL